MATLVTPEEGPTIMTNIVGCAPEKVAIGMPVEVTLDRRDLDSEIQADLKSGGGVVLT